MFRPVLFSYCRGRLKMTVNLRSQIRSRDFSTGQPFQSLNSLLINDITDVAFSVFLNDYHIAYAPFVIEKSFLSLQYPPTVFLKNHVFQLPSRPQDTALSFKLK